ncbi:DUF6221 family protein [Tessaracoccus sp.]
MDPLVEFLLRQIGEDETLLPPPNGTARTRWSPTRIRAICAAHRQIVLDASRYTPGQRGYPAAQRTLKLLAVPYLDKFGYNPDWKP